jgi:hypothetical protein
MRHLNKILFCSAAAASLLLQAGGAGAGAIPSLSSAVGRAMPAQIVSVQLFGY